MLKRTVLWILLCAVSISLPAQKRRKSDNYTIYSKALTEYLNNYYGADTVTRLVIRRQKQKDNIGCALVRESGNDALELYFANQNLVLTEGNSLYPDTLLLDLICRLDKVNRYRKGKIRDRFEVPYEVNLIPEREMDELFNGSVSAGWDRFYRKYPGSFGVVELSNIVYSGDKRYALFYFGYRLSSTWGYGCLLLLDLQNENRMILKQVQVWIS